MLFETQLLEHSLDAATLRNRVIANNIANQNTPGYVAETVLFEKELRQATDKEAVRPRVVAQKGHVDINNEMCSLAKNQIMYQALCSRISGIFGTLKWVIENAGR